MTDQRRDALIWIVFLAHLSALVFGLIGILIMLPHPELWQNDPRAVRVFDFSINHAGPLHIVLGALAMFLFGARAIGLRKTTIFFVASTAISLTSELLGTGTGWPFGNYAYTNYLGWKVLNHVPFSIPLSWFYLGFSSYLLASVIVAWLELRSQTAWRLILGVWFLTVWDLVLDPAMAHHSLRIKFWVWDESGPYFGMPIKNFIGWSVTGLIFMAVARLLWRQDIDPTTFPPLFPLAFYGLNVVWAMILSFGVGLWIPVVIAAILGLLPAAYALQAKKDWELHPPRALNRPGPVGWRQSPVGR